MNKNTQIWQYASPILAFHETALQYPEARIGGSECWLTFQEFNRRADCFAQHLHLRGITQSDRVVIFSANSIEMLVAIIGAQKLGAIAVPINCTLVGDWLKHQLLDCDPQFLVVDSALAPAIEELGPQVIPGISYALSIGGKAHLPDLSVEPFDAIDHAQGTRPKYLPEPDELALIIYTSGTTGRSKGCAISHHYLVNFSRLLSETNKRQPSEIYYLTGPLSHIAAIANTNQALMTGGDLYIGSKFRPDTFWEEIHYSGATATSLMGLMGPLLLKQVDSAMSRQCYGQIEIVTGTFTEEVGEKLSQRFGMSTAYLPLYGQTEAGYTLSIQDAKPRPGTIGLENDSFEVCIVDDSDHEVPIGHIGEIIVRPKHPNVMFNGYWRNPEATMQRMRNLWWHTGDYGRRDDAGYYYFTDRAEDRIRRSGENISSFELDEVFSKHPDFAAVATHAIRSELQEDEVKLTAVLLPGKQISPQELWDWVQGRVPRHAIPRFIEFRVELPKNANGKILKGQLRSEGVTTKTWDRRAETL